MAHASHKLIMLYVCLWSAWEAILTINQPLIALCLCGWDVFLTQKTAMH